MIDPGGIVQTEILRNIKEKKYKIGIVGLGYVGLPLAVEFANKGFNVVGVDLNNERVGQINSAINYVKDVNQKDLKSAIRKRKLKAFCDFDVLRECNAIIICVPTPLNKNKQPDISYIRSTANKLALLVKKGQLIILESTTYPGTTEEVLSPILETSGLKAGRDFFLAFSPERVDPGNLKFKIKNIPKVVGGIDPVSSKLAEQLYRQIIPEVLVVSKPRVAEMEKLLENIFRNVNIALVNELAILCKKMKIDIWEVIAAAKTKPYGFMAFYPGPGLGGHCIPLDPFYLSWKAKEYNVNTRFIELAGEVNDSMPDYIVRLIQDGLNTHCKSLKDSRILILGVAYKKDIDDMRESPALKIIEILKDKKAELSYNDPFVPEIRINGETIKSVPLNPSSLKKADCVVIVTDHSVYDYKRIVTCSKLIVDTRNATSGLDDGHSAKIIKI